MCTKEADTPKRFLSRQHCLERNGVQNDEDIQLHRCYYRRDNTSDQMRAGGVQNPTHRRVF